MPAGETQKSNEVIIERLTGLKEDLEKLNTVVTCLNENYQGFMTRYVQGHTEVEMKASAAHQRLDRLEPRLEGLEKAVAPLIMANKVIVWIAGVLGLSVIAMIWSVLTHQVQMVFP
jgi:DNA repair exonuclease SbcCD ATPase subunit